MNVTLDVSQIDRLADVWRRAPELTTQIIGEAMDEAVLLLQREVTEGTPVGALGNLRNSWFSDVVSLSGQVVGMVATPVEYAESVELGTKPHFPPLEPLVDWVVAKLGVPRKEARSIAFLVARKISRSGTKAKLFVKDAFDANAPQVRAMFGLAVQRIALRLVSI